MINICKMKTHALERITGAVKNLYGCITGVNKAAGHAAYPDSWVFADMLTDLHRCVRPRLHIMDGIIAMEGNGPTSGTPIAMNVLLFSPLRWTRCTPRSSTSTRRLSPPACAARRAASA